MPPCYFSQNTSISISLSVEISLKPFKIFKKIYTGCHHSNLWKHCWISVQRGTGCAPLLADMFRHAYEADFFKLVLNRTLVHIFTSSFGNIDDVSSLSNSRRLYASNLPKISLTYSTLLKRKVCFLTLPSPWNRQRRLITSKTLRQTWWLYFSKSHLPPSVTRFQLHHCIMFTYNSDLILRFVTSTVIFFA